MESISPFFLNNLPILSFFFFKPLLKITSVQPTELWVGNTFRAQGGHEGVKSKMLSSFYPNKIPPTFSPEERSKMWALEKKKEMLLFHLRCIRSVLWLRYKLAFVLTRVGRRWPWIGVESRGSVRGGKQARERRTGLYCLTSKPRAVHKAEWHGSWFKMAAPAPHSSWRRLLRTLQLFLLSYFS